MHFISHIFGFCGEQHPSLLIGGLGCLGIITMYLKKIVYYILNKIKELR